MSPSLADLSTLSRLLDEALDLEPAQAEAWLAALPEAHRHLLPQLREMLAEHLSPGHAGFMSDGPKLEGGAADETVARPEDLVGPYRLIREIGRGGMGAVWLAERADGSLKRQVALKLPRLAWGAGLAERMARERDIGALLEHPNIARLYDAGVDASGRPYLALEYIDGQPLDAWCEAKALGVPERLRLFLQVARAVAYAHGRLVVHRDLKPSNVLVTADGQAHLLDFGIAKLLHEAAPGDLGLTQEQGRVLTPHYASPEQIQGETITVASDVYSLGVLLYELLTGRLPFHATSPAALEAAVLEGEPPLASSRAQDKATARALRGEIDAILGKALKRVPALRYATVDALAQDIERHLKGERVLAQPDSAWYRIRKAAMRHRFGFAAVAAILATVLAGRRRRTGAGAQGGRGGRAGARREGLRRRRVQGECARQPGEQRTAAVAGADAAGARRASDRHQVRRAAAAAGRAVWRRRRHLRRHVEPEAGRGIRHQADRGARVAGCECGRSGPRADPARPGVAAAGQAGRRRAARAPRDRLGACKPEAWHRSPTCIDRRAACAIAR